MAKKPNPFAKMDEKAKPGKDGKGGKAPPFMKGGKAKGGKK